MAERLQVVQVIRATLVQWHDVINLCSRCDPAIALALHAKRASGKHIGANRHPPATACPYLLIVQGALPPGDPLGLPVVLVVDPLVPPVQLLVLVVVVVVVVRVDVEPNRLFSLPNTLTLYVGSLNAATAVRSMAPNPPLAMFWLAVNPAVATPLIPATVCP